MGESMPEQESLSPRLVRGIVVSAAVLSGLNLLGTAFSPWLLINHPLVLIALSSEGRHLFLAGGRVDVVEVVAVGAARRVLSMISTYGLAAVYGFAALRWIEQRYPRIGALAAALERLFRRRGAVLLVLLPSYTLSAVAGVVRSPLRPVVIATVLGQTLLVIAYVRLGEAMSDWTGPLLGWLRLHLVAATAVCVAAVTLHQIWSRWRKRRP